MYLCIILIGTLVCAKGDSRKECKHVFREEHAKEKEMKSAMSLTSTYILSLTLWLGTGVCSQAMDFPGSGWTEKSPESQGVDSGKLNAAMSYLASKCGSQGTSQAVVIRNGYMIWKGSDIDNDHNVWSTTKSFTSTVLGLLIEDGKCTLDTYAKDFHSALASEYPDVKLRHFATMTSGYDGMNHRGESACQSHTPFEPAPPHFPPGSKYEYCDDAMNQFANVLTRIANQEIEKLFRDRIARKIGMNDAKWDWADWGVVDGLVANGGAGNKGKGIHISARELARFGHLFLNRGNWNGQQLISAAWVDQATSAQVPASLPGSNGRYCYNWWRLPSAPVSTYMAAGHNNNKCIVIRDWNMVIARTGTDGNIDDDIYGAFLEKVEDALSPGEMIFNVAIRHDVVDPDESSGLWWSWQDQRTHKPRLVVSYTSGGNPQTKTYQHGLDGMDNARAAYIKQAGADSGKVGYGEGHKHNILPKKAPARRGFFWCDMRDIPVDATINGATLYLHFHTEEGLARATDEGVIGIYECDKEWNWDVMDWINYDRGKAWDTPGGDFGAKIRDIRIQEDILDHGWGKSNPDCRFSFTAYVQQLQANRGRTSAPESTNP
jgi:hypothetical protein